MLRFNTFRARRYLRTKFVEGKFLLASEASDLELEILDLLRTSVQSTMGDVAIADAWKVERQSDTTLLIKPGEAWFRGLPFMLRSGKDQQVTGAILTLGTVPVGVSAADDASGLGKVITFNDSTTTPTNDYRFVITAREELVTDIDDPFLKNANLSESTAQKVRLNFRLNIVPVSSQTESPIPYRDENSTSGGPVTNFPDAGGTASPNFVNRISVSPTAAGNGELVSLTPVTGSEAIDGRDLEIIVRNDPGLGGGNPIPNSPTEQQAFANGKLIDSVGTEYHLNTIFNDTISTQVVLRIDKEPDQPNPEILNGSPYIIQKRDVYSTDDVNGNPQGFIHWDIAELVWDSTKLISHQSKITDLRTSVEERDVFQNKTNIKDNLILAEGGDISFNATSGLLSWNAEYRIKHPFGSDNTIATNSINMIDGSSLVYEMDLISGGSIEKGNLVINITTGGSTITIDPITYSNVSIGNVIVDNAGSTAPITSIDPDTNQITVSGSLASGSGTIFLDQYIAGTAPLTSNAFHLAVRSGNRVYFYRGLLELEDGETSQIGDGLSSQILTYMGATGEADSDPNYSSTTVVTQGDDLTTAIGKLDADVGSLNSPTYSSNIRGTSGESLEDRAGVLTDAVGDSQEDRSAYLRSNDNIVWTGTQLEFTSDIVLEIINTKSGTTTVHNIVTASSPIAIADGESVWVSVDRSSASETLTVNNSGTIAIPAQVQADKDVFVLFKRIDTGGAAYLHLPFHKQVLNEGQSVRLGASGSGAGVVKSKYLDPISTTLPTGTTVTIDGQSGVNGDTVLFTNLTVNNNRVYELGGVGVSLTWTPVRAFDSDFDPIDGDEVRIQAGDAFSEQKAVFNGTDFLVNDIVRYFDGVSGNFWELGSIKNTTLNDNSVDSVFEVNVTGSENIIVNYSITRGSDKETGELYITSDGSTAQVSRNVSYIGDVGVEFTADISSGDLRLRYTTTNTGSNADMKYFLKRWSDSLGGPTGVPNYSGATGGSVSAAGVLKDIQYHGPGGLLAGDNRFQWDSSLGALDMNGLEKTPLSSGITINDNQAAPAVLFSFDFATYPNAIIDYSIERNGEQRTGTLKVASNSSTAADNDSFVETAATGVTLSADISGSDTEIRYTSTSTGFTGTFKYSIRRWS